MPSYVITGVSRGMGFAFLENLSSNPNNTVIGLVRNVSDTKANIAAWNRNNIHIIHGDLDDYASLKEAADTTSKLTNGSLDYIIANAARLQIKNSFDSFSELGSDPAALDDFMLTQFKTNTVANIHLFNLFMPLVLKGKAKKVITISSGMADTDLVAKYGIYESGAYAVSKAAMNMVVAKFQAEYKKDDVLFLAICPGLVDTGLYNILSEEDVPKLTSQVTKFKEYAPHFTSGASPDESVKDVLAVIEKASLQNGDGGAFLSHTGTKQWL